MFVEHARGPGHMISSTPQMGCGDAHLKAWCLGDGDGKIRSSRLSLATGTSWARICQKRKKGKERGKEEREGTDPTLTTPQVVVIPSPVQHPSPAQAANSASANPSTLSPASAQPSAHLGRNFRSYPGSLCNKLPPQDSELMTSPPPGL